MEEALEECLKEMESNYDILLERAQNDESHATKFWCSAAIDNEEKRVEQYLAIKEYFHKLDTVPLLNVNAAPSIVH